jgi:hypothetical protein
MHEPADGHDAGEREVARPVKTRRANVVSKPQCANDNQPGRWLAAQPWLD